MRMIWKISSTYHAEMSEWGSANIMKNFVCAAVLLGSLLCAVPATRAQVAVTGQITGVVTDSTGASIEGATVAVTGTSLMQSRAVKTQANGVYLVDQLPPGEYSVTYSQLGFESVVRNGIVLTAGFTATLNTTLSVGKVTDTVTVAGSDPPVVDVQRTTTPTTFDST